MRVFVGGRLEGVGGGALSMGHRCRNHTHRAPLEAMERAARENRLMINMVTARVRWQGRSRGWMDGGGGGYVSARLIEHHYPCVKVTSADTPSPARGGEGGGCKDAS